MGRSISGGFEVSHRRKGIICGIGLLLAIVLAAAVALGMSPLAQAGAEENTSGTDSGSIAIQNYQPTRSVIGTPGEDYLTTPECASGAWYAEYHGGYDNATDTFKYRAEYHLDDPESSVVHFSNRYMYCEYNFGYGGTGYIEKNDPTTWPANMQSGLNIVEWTDDTVILEYTLSAADVEWGNANKTKNQFAIAPVADYLKLPDTVEAAWSTYKYDMTGTDMTTGEQVYERSGSQSMVTDKRTVEIDEQIAPVDNGVVGTYTTDKVTLSPGQVGSVQITLSRPVGFRASGACDVNCPIPAGMTYVSGSASYASTSSATVTLNDSSGAPKLHFSNLPVGQTITLTYQVKAPTTVSDYTEFSTSDLLSNLYQAWVTGTPHNSVSPGQKAYTQSEYDTTASRTFAVSALPSANKTIDSVIYNADGTATVGYSVSIVNATSAEIDNYKLTDTLTNGTVDATSVSGASWDADNHTFTVASIPAGGVSNFTYTATIADSAVGAINAISPVGSEWSLSKTRVEGDGSTSEDNSTLKAGDDVWYLVKVDNSNGTSEIPAEASKVTDSFRNLDYVGADVSQGSISAVEGSTITWSTGIVAANSTANAWLHFTVNQSAATDEATPYTAVNSASTYSHSTITENPIADVHVDKDVQSIGANVGDEAVYTLTITNHGAPVVNYGLTDIPTGLAYLRHSCSGATATRTTDGFEVERIGANSTAVITATYKIEALPCANMVMPAGSSDLVISKVRVTSESDMTPATGAVLVGDTIYYQITEKNTGAQAESATITDTPRTGLSITAATTQSGTATLNTDGTVTWTTDEIAGGEDATLLVTATVSQDALANGMAINSATDGIGTSVVTTPVSDNPQNPQSGDSSSTGATPTVTSSQGYPKTGDGNLVAAAALAALAGAGSVLLFRLRRRNNR